MFLSNFIPIKRKFRKIVLGLLVAITVVLLVVLNNVGGLNEALAEHVTVPDSISTYISDYYKSVEDEIDTSYPFAYKTFDEKHPTNSSYNKDIREMFTYLNDLDSSKDIYYDDVSLLIEENLLDHTFVAFGSSDDSFMQASEGKPYDLSPRLYWDLLLNQVAQDSENIAFTWYDFISNVEYNNYLRNIHYASNHEEMWDAVDCNLLNSEIFNKEILQKMRNPIFFYHTEEYSKDEFLREHESGKLDDTELGNYCQIIDDEAFRNTSLAQFSPKILQTQVNFGVRPEVYFLQSTNRIFNSLEKPLSVTIINIKDGLFKQVFVKNRTTFVGENYVTNGEFEKHQKRMSQDPKKILSAFEKLDFASLSPLYTANNSQYFLQEDDFLFDLASKIESLSSHREAGNLTIAQEHYLHSLEFNYNSHHSSQKKFFTESEKIINTYGKGFHHDHRFFRSQVSANMGTLKLAILQGMLKTLTAALKSLGVAGWISHGNMYGWLYNGLPFPYDDDIDFQLPIKHLHVLAEHFNQTMLLQDPRIGNGRYFLDIGNLGGRGNGNGLNSIDGRLIDMDTGLYIDITGLAFNGEALDLKYFDLLKEILDENDVGLLTNEQDLSLSPLEKLSPGEYRDWINNNEGMSDSNKEELLANLAAAEKKQHQSFEALKNFNKKNGESEYVDMYINTMTYNERFSVNKKLGFVTCKNRHFVDVEDYKTLSNTFYQQTAIILPANHMDLLHKEYDIPAEYDFLSFESYVFQPNMKKWMKRSHMEDSMNILHYKPWNYALELTIEDFVTFLQIDPSKQINSPLTLEETEILIFNMCDFENEITLNLERFNKVVELANWATEIPQSEYRFREMALLNEIGKESVISPEYLKATAELYNTFSDYLIRLENSGEGKLYKDPFDYLKVIEQLYGQQIYGWDMTQICRKHVLRTIQGLEESKFKEVEFLGKYNEIGKPVWDIPDSNGNSNPVDNIIYG